MFVYLCKLLFSADVERIVWSIVIGVAGVGLILAILLFQAARKVNGRKKLQIFFAKFDKCL